MKKIARIVALALAIVLCFALVACNNGGFQNPGDNLGGGGVGEIPTDTDSVETDKVTVDDFSSLAGETDADGVIVDGSAEQYVIESAGTYVLSGVFSKGIVVSVKDKESVRLVLNGASIRNDSGIAISNTNKKSSLIITLVQGMQNGVENGGDGVNAIHVKGSLSINGSGSLSVSSASKNAIKVSKDFAMVDANLTLSAQNHALSARSVEIHDATLTVTSAQKDGINAECDDDTTAFPENYEQGYVILKNTNYTCLVAGDGIQADTLCYIEGGNINVEAVATFVVYSEENMQAYDLEKDDFRYSYSGGVYYKKASDDRFNEFNAYAMVQSTKGIKVGEIKYENADGSESVVSDGEYLIVVKGDCTLNINSSDDAIHTNSGDVLIESGNITINTYDDGITADGLTQIDGGKIDIQSSYEGIEGACVKINGGEISVVSSDDGVNAASDDTSINEYIIISGGSLIVKASGDGLDSNGSILITGGSVVVHGPTSGMDAALDADSGIIVQGGVLFASSTLGMVETPSKNSTQHVVSYAQKTALSANSTFDLKDENGNTLLNVETAKNCQSIIFSCPQLEDGKEYTIYCNGTQMAKITIDGVITTVGTSQNAGPGGGMGGPGGPGVRPR